MFADKTGDTILIENIAREQNWGVLVDDWPKRWIRYQKHRKATLRSWNDLSARILTASPHSASQYNPHIFGDDAEVEFSEMQCIEQGTLITATPHRRTYYMRDLQQRIVGVCSGMETQYVFAEWLSTGEIHGRPISQSALKKLGVRLE